MYPGPDASGSPSARILRRKELDEKESSNSRSGCRDSLFFSRKPVEMMMMMMIMMMRLMMMMMMIMMMMRMRRMMMMMML
jgi:hypothetical protein